MTDGKETRQKTKPRRQGAGHPAATSPWEWAVAALGALLFLGAAGSMVYFGLLRPDGPPDLVVEAVATESGDGGHLLRFQVENRGNSTAAAVRVVGTLWDGERLVEEARAEIDYVPQHSRRGGGLVLRHDPAAYRLELGVAGYAEP